MKKIFYSIALLLGMVAMTGCEMREKNYSTIDARDYYKSESNIKGAIASIYAQSANKFCEYFYMLQEFSADQITWRSWNGGSWGWDEGEKGVLTMHSWNSESAIMKSAWSGAWEVIGLCNQLLQDMENIDLQKVGISEEKLLSYKAEIHTMRAWAYYNNFELWGGVLPICETTLPEVLPGSASENFDEGCKKIYDFIAKDLDDWYMYLPKKGDAYRASQTMNRMIKMRLLLNSEVFTGVARYDECEQLAEQLKGNEFGGDFDIVPDYRAIYELDNNLCQEVVFAFACKPGKEQLYGMKNMRNTPFLPYNYGEFTGSSNTTYSGWNCVCVVPSYDNAGNDLGSSPKVNADGTAYNSDAPVCFLDAAYGDKLGAIYERFENGDIRKQSYDFPYNGRWNGGLFLKGRMLNRETGEPIVADADRDGEPLVYVDQIGQFKGANKLGHELRVIEGPRWGQTNSGYRLMKYPMYPTETGKDFQNIAEVEFRWAEVYYTLAECKMRKNKGGDMKDLVNQVRYRYFPNGAPTDDVAGSWTEEEWMLHQWGLEFLSEGRRRRTDLRRFHRFTEGQWWFHGRAMADDGGQFPAVRNKRYEWFPLPQVALGVNEGLKQNPNY